MFVDTSISSRQYFLKVNSTDSEILLNHDLTDQVLITVSMKIGLDKNPAYYPKVYTQVKTTDNTWEEGYLETTAKLSPAVWYTLSFTYDNTTGYLKLYIDGVLSATKELSGDLDLTYSAPRFGISPVAECNYFIRDLVFYNSVLTDEEVLALNSGITETTVDMVSLWLFDEGYGTTVTDEVAAYTGTVSDCSWTEAAGILRLDPVNSGVLLEHELTAQTSITVSMYIKLDKTVAEFPTVFAQIKTTGNTWEEGYLETLDTIKPSIWYKLAFTYNNSTGALTIYINDEEAATTTLSGNLVLTDYEPQFGLVGIESGTYNIRELIFFDSYQTLETLEELNDLYFEPTDDMVSLWLFNEGYGNITYDSVASYEGTIIKGSWEQLAAVRIYPKVARVLNSSSSEIYVRDASIFEVGDTIYVVNPDTNETLAVNSITSIDTNILTLADTLSIDDTNAVVIKDYNMPIYPEFNLTGVTYNFDLFNYYKTSEPELFVVVKSDEPKSVTVTPVYIQYRTPGLLTQDITDDFAVFRVELIDNGTLQPYYLDGNFYINIRAVNNYYALYLGEDTYLYNVLDEDFTSIKIEQWIKVITADNDPVYLFGQLETADSPYEDSYVESSTPLSVGYWYHIGLVYDETDGYLRLYIDGTLDTEQYLGGQINSDRLISIGLADTESYTAIYDEIKVWNIGDAVEDINTKLYGYESGLIYYYSLDTNIGTIADDISINGYDGIIVGDDYSWESSEIELESPDVSDTLDVHYLNKILRDKYVFKPKTLSSSEYLRLYNNVIRLSMEPDFYEFVIDNLAMYDYDSTLYTVSETFYYNNIKLYKINHSTGNTIKLITADINDTIYRATLVSTNGTNIQEAISKSPEKLLAFVFDSGLVYLYVPKYFKHAVASVRIYES